MRHPKFKSLGNTLGAVHGCVRTCLDLPRPSQEASANLVSTVVRGRLCGHRPEEGVEDQARLPSIEVVPLRVAGGGRVWTSLLSLSVLRPVRRPAPSASAARYRGALL